MYISKWMFEVIKSSLTKEQRFVVDLERFFSENESASERKISLLCFMCLPPLAHWPHTASPLSVWLFSDPTLHTVSNKFQINYCRVSITKERVQAIIKVNQQFAKLSKNIASV